MLILGQISQQPHAAIIPRGITLKSWRESITVNAVWQVGVIFTALPWHGLMAWAACTLCQRKLPVDPCCSLMPVLNCIATKWCGKSFMNSTLPGPVPQGTHFLPACLLKKKKLALVFSFATVLFHTHNGAAQWPFLLAYLPNGKIKQ